MSLATAAALYGTTEESLEKLGSFESDVYAFQGPNGPSILKVVHPDHRTVEQVAAEVEWVLALKRAGINVAEPLPAVSGAWVEQVDDPERVLVAFRRAPGRATRPTDWTESRIQAWGEVLGQMQAHSRTYTPVGEPRRYLLDKTYVTRAAEIVTDDDDFVEAAQALVGAAERLLGPGADAGLVHADLHGNNILLHDEQWTAIDFDDCGYASYAFDLAMPVFYALLSQPEVPADQAAAVFVPPFMRGFGKHAPVPRGGAEGVADSLRVRQAELVLALRYKLPTEAWTDHLRYMEQTLRAKVKSGQPVSTAEFLRQWIH